MRWLTAVQSQDYTGALAVPDLPRKPGSRKWEDLWYRRIIIGGKRAGTWRRTVTREGVLLERNLFASLDGSQSRALEAAAERYGRFLGLPVTLA